MPFTDLEPGGERGFQISGPAMGYGNKRCPAACGFNKGGAVGAEHEEIVATDRWASWPNADQESNVLRPLNLMLEGSTFAPILLGLWPTMGRPSFTFSEKTPSNGCRNSVSPPGKIR